MRAALALLAAAVLASGCTSGASGDTGDRPAGPASAGPRSTPAVTPVDVESAARARGQLAVLRVAPRRPPVGYVRDDDFGSTWVDTDHDGCNQRDDVLLRDAVPGSTTLAPQGSCDHDVLAGTWVDPYTGRTIALTDMKQPAQAEAVQIDHVVPLAEAWASGASAWSQDRRLAFANDLAELLAVDGPTNASKGDDDPAAWRPRKAFQCQYARRWIALKTRWELAVDPPERRALGQLLDHC